MSVLSDRTIRDLCTGEEPMIFPFVETSVRVNEQGDRIPSYGLSSYGYDVRLAPVFEIFKRGPGLVQSIMQKTLSILNVLTSWVYKTKNNRLLSVIDPCNPPEDIYERVEADSCLIPPHGYMLAHTLEYIRVPRDVIITCLTKSTYARLGIMINVTPLEPGWEGQLVVEIANLTNHPVKITASVGIAQFVFHRGDVPCETSYADRNGKYQKQSGIMHAKV